MIIPLARLCSNSSVAMPSQHPCNDNDGNISVSGDDDDDNDGDLYFFRC
jgi:hypothetical protein